MADDPTTTPPSLSDTVSQLVGSAGGAAPNGPGTVTGLGGPATFTDTQRRIAFMLLWIMIGVIGIITIVALGYSVRCSIGGGASCDNGSSAIKLLTDSMSPIFTAMIGLVGSVVGFYFGSKQAS